MSETSLRRSKRARKQTKYNEDSEDEDETQRSRKLTTPTPGERQKTMRRKRGLLQRITEFPLDVVFDIFSHLTPHDLLNLSRTSKHLRSIILSRSTTSVWRSARSNVDGLPECPEDMSEPAYAHLCFDIRCHHCESKHPAVNLMWHCRTRSCHACLDGPFYSEEPLDYDYPHSSTANRFYPTKMDLDLWGIIKHRGDTIRKEQQSYTFYCSKTLRNELAEGLKANASDPNWKKQMIQRGERISEHVEELEAWSLTLRDERQADLRRRRKERENAILQRLVDAGWGEEMDKQRHMNGLRIFREFKLGTQAKKLTDKDWDELEPKLEAALERAKENRLTMEFREKWYRRYETFRKLVQAELNKLPFNTVGPNVFDLVNEPEFQAKLLSPIDHELTSGSMAEVFDSLPQIRARWVEDKEKDLVNLLKERGVQNATPDTLHYASTIFTCKFCSVSCVYPRPLMHHCSRRLGFGFDQTRPSVQDFMSTMHGGPWNVKIFDVRKEVWMAAKKIMKICDIPANATLDDVKDSRCWVQKRFYHCAMGRQWLGPVARAMYEFGHSLEDEHVWTRADDEELNQLVASEESRRYCCTLPRVMCNHCETFHHGLSIFEHLKENHDLTSTSVTSKDVTLPIDTAPYSLHHEPVRPLTEA